MKAEVYVDGKHIGTAQDITFTRTADKMKPLQKFTRLGRQYTFLSQQGDTIEAMDDNGLIVQLGVDALSGNQIYLKNTEGGHNKYYLSDIVESNGSFNVFNTWGRIDGDSAQSGISSTCPNLETARIEQNKLVRSKIRKGYVQVSNR